MHDDGAGLSPLALDVLQRAEADLGLPGELCAAHPPSLSDVAQGATIYGVAIHAASIVLYWLSRQGVWLFLTSTQATQVHYGAVGAAGRASMCELSGQDRVPQWPKVAVGFGLMPTSRPPTGDEIRRAREARRMTQADLATSLGVGKRTIGRWERSESVPRSALGALIRVLDLPSITDHPDGASDAPPMPDEQIETALRQASHLQILGELARRIQAAQPPPGTPPQVPQVHLRWPKASAPDQASEGTLISDLDNDSPA